MASITVRCEGAPEDGWVCRVTLREGGLDISSHFVRVWQAELTRFAPGFATPDALVKASFAFLLARESPQMILRSFDLTEIGRYFPEYEATVRRAINRGEAGG
jgi:hypothetical protein